MSGHTARVRAGTDRTSLYTEITDKIIAELEAGRIPWVQPWGTAAIKAPLAMPRNASTQRGYSGINVLILWGAVVEHGFSGQSWLTFRQALGLGGHVRKGERGTTVVYADRFTPDDERRRAAEAGEEPGAIPFLKRFTVFNTDQCDCLPEDVAALVVPLPPGQIEPRAEALIAETLTAAVPGSSVVGEELSPSAAWAGDVVWIVDPLDGTTNFLHRYPQYAVSIGALVDGALRIGVIHDVARDLGYWGATGGGAWQGDRRLGVSRLSQPRHALVGTGFPFKDLPLLRRYLDQFAAVMGVASGIRRAGSAALDLADVAAGRLDAFWELTLAPWDVAAGVVLIREAGGIVTTLEGEEDVLRHGSVIAGNPAMHRWLLDLLRST